MSELIYNGAYPPGEHEALESRLKEIRVEEDRLEQEKNSLYELIEKLELAEIEATGNQETRFSTKAVSA